MREDRSRVRLRGFTLVELVVAMTVLSIVVTILAGVFVTNADTFGFMVRSANEVSELRLASGRIALELRSIRDRKSVIRATESQIVFINREGNTTDIDFDARSSLLTLNGKNLARNVSTFRLRYLDTRGRDVGKPRLKPETDIWSIEVEMSTAGRNNLKMISRAYPRNFM